MRNYLVRCSASLLLSVLLSGVALSCGLLFTCCGAEAQKYASGGMKQLPFVKAGQSVGTAKGPVDVFIRDKGTFMDPRAVDWYQQ